MLGRVTKVGRQKSIDCCQTSFCTMERVFMHGSHCTRHNVSTESLTGATLPGPPKYQRTRSANFQGQNFAGNPLTEGRVLQVEKKLISATSRPEERSGGDFITKIAASQERCRDRGCWGQKPLGAAFWREPGQIKAKRRTRAPDTTKGGLSGDRPPLVSGQGAGGRPVRFNEVAQATRRRQATAPAASSRATAATNMP